MMAKVAGGTHQWLQRLSADQCGGGGDEDEALPLLLLKVPCRLLFGPAQPSAPTELSLPRLVSAKIRWGGVGHFLQCCQFKYNFLQLNVSNFGKPQL